VKTNRNKARDAAPIGESVVQPGIRFVPVKSVARKVVLSMHRVGEASVRRRTAQASWIRRLLAEIGLVPPAGNGNIVSKVPAMVDAATGLAAKTREFVGRLMEHFTVLDAQVQELERQIRAWHPGSECSRQRGKTPGLGPQGASASVASIADASDLKRGGKWRPGSGWCRGETRSGAKPGCRESANVATRSCEAC
jgi:transposase